jgi:hypothetical protein
MTESQVTLPKHVFAFAKLPSYVVKQYTKNEIIFCFHECFTKQLILELKDILTILHKGQQLV